MGEAYAARPGQGYRQTPVIQVSPMGNVGNRMIQYMAALALADRVERARVVQIHLPEWGIQIAPLAEPPRPMEIVTTPAIDQDRLALALNAGSLAGVDIRTYAQRMSNFGPPSRYRDVFKSPLIRGAGPGELLINIRQGDVLDARHPDYVLLPIDFYADLVAQTGLAPVFMGQLEDTPYIEALRRRFPAARMVPSQGAVADFAFIRASRHIVPAISTFSWLAAWLSEADTIHLPIIGLFNPAQSRATDLLPLDDTRYSFSLFPFHYAVPVAGFEAAHASIRQLWRLLPADALRTLLARQPPPRDHAAYLRAFDESFYLHHHPDIARVVADGHMPSGRHHFEHHGFFEGREPIAIDYAWYCATYPIAAIEMSQGDACDPVDHWVRFGRARGYRRGPAG